MSPTPVEFYVSKIGAPDPGVLARFAGNERCLY